MNIEALLNEEPLLSYVLLFTRIIVVLVYLVSGIDKSINRQAAREEFERENVAMINIMLPLTVILHLLGSIAILLGVFVTEASLLLAVFLFGATVQVHCFWKMKGEEMIIHSRIFLVNLSALGALLLLAVVGPGKFVLFG